MKAFNLKRDMEKDERGKSNLNEKTWNYKQMIQLLMLEAEWRQMLNLY